MSALTIMDCPPALQPFVAAGILGPAEVHAAARLTRLHGADDDQVLLAVALAVRGPRLGHVYLDLATVAGTVTSDDDLVDVTALPWPEPGAWRDALASTTLVHDVDASGSRHRAEGTDVPPLVLDGTRCYLDRYARYEEQVAVDLRQRAASPAPDVDLELLEDGLRRSWPPDRADRHQVAAARTAVTRRLAVLAGGPGTGKTFTIARILALLDEQAQAAGLRPPQVAIAAPTGKAADRVGAAIHQAAGALDTDPQVRARLRAAESSTLHRLLGSHPDRPTRFRHDRHDPLPHGVVIVDETSMVSLGLMARLLDAVRPSARLILVGDPDQLASVEAGAVLGDLVHGSAAALGDGLVVLQRPQRFSATSGIAALADAVRRGDADTAIATLRGRDDLDWVAVEAAAHDDPALASIRQQITVAAADTVTAARAGDGDGALQAWASVRVLCAHRRGPVGVGGWTRSIERWLTAAVPGVDPRRTWEPGRPVMVTRNDPRLGLFNGDVGVVVTGDDGGPMIAFRGAEGIRHVAPSRLDDLETVHALTIHKSQGSQFTHVAVILPDPGSRLLTRELLYTAITRGRQRVTVLGSEASLRAAIARPVARASGLARLLAPADPG